MSPYNEQDLRDLAEQQGALRRVATLVARGAEPEELFGAIATETARLLGVDAISLIRWDPHARMFTQIAITYDERAVIPSGSRVGIKDSPLGALILATGRPARINDYARLPGRVPARHVANGFGQGIGAPIIVNGAVWGYIGAYSQAGEALPDGWEERLAEFTNLMAMAVANVEARDELRDLADSQGALRRVATLAAQGGEPQAVFTAVATEAAHLLGVGAVSLIRWDPDAHLLTKIYGTHGQRAAAPDGSSWTLADGPESELVVRTGHPARIDDWTVLPGEIAARHVANGFGQCVAAPIYVEGELWGILSAFGEAGQVLPPGSEHRLADFTILIASAIANAQARDELRALAEQQGAALRRVATLVAQQASPTVIFGAVAGEASRALRVPHVDVVRREADGRLTQLGSTVTAGSASSYRHRSAGIVASQDRVARAVIATRHAARDDEADTSTVGAPVSVDGAIWGVIIVTADEVLPADTETRLTDFTHLVASSISNVAARDKLIASRARIVSASDETRRRIERNLHDGVQQRILAIALGLRAVRAQSQLPTRAEEGLDQVAADLESVLEEIRVFSRGLHPALLSRSGLGPSLRDLARRSPIPVDVDASGIPRLPQPVETAIYYVVSEALANAAKHSRADGVTVTVTADHEAARARVSDDGAGGASPGNGTGLIGLIDRVEALGGRLILDSLPGQGTTISVELPLTPQAIDGPPSR
jgi:signal transduction histidine kinase